SEYLGTRTPALWFMILMGSACFFAIVTACIFVCNFLQLLITGSKFRRRQRSSVDIVGVAHPHLQHVRLIESPAPMAFNIPGTDPRVVISTGLMNLLHPQEVEAVIQHELSHLNQRHHLVLAFFEAYQRSFSRWLPSKINLSQIHLLLELLADHGTHN